MDQKQSKAAAGEGSGREPARGSWAVEQAQKEPCHEQDRERKGCSRVRETKEIQPRYTTQEL